jgi:hypothetical protein
MAPGKAICWSVLGLALFAYVLPCAAQVTKESKEPTFWEAWERLRAGTAAQLVLAQNPLTVAVLRAEGLRMNFWPEPEFVGDLAPALNSEWLESVLDDTPMPNYLKGIPKNEKRKDQIAVYEVWNQAIINAFNTPADAFAKSAEDNSHVTFAHLWGNPEQYRGKVIPLKGLLIRLRKWDAPIGVQQHGIKYVYEGWVVGPTKGAYPFCIVFPLLPDGLKEAEDMRRQVSFNGYFLKKLKYPAGNGSKFLQTPVLIGPTVTLAKEAPPPPESSPISMGVVACVMLVVVAVSAGLIFLSWYFRRGDLAVKKRLAEMQAERAMAMMEHAENAGPVPEAPNSQSFMEDPPVEGVKPG